jgi:hypothetical protein
MGNEKEARPPGLKWRKRASGPPVPYWLATDAAIKAGYPVKAVNLAPFADDEAALRARCIRLDAEMVEFLNGPAEDGPVTFDGRTIGSLLTFYEKHPDSPYQTLKPASLVPYAVYLRKLRETLGSVRLANVTGLDVQRWHKLWRKPDEGRDREKLGAAKMALNVLKSALSFALAAGHQEAAPLLMMIRELKLPQPRPRDQAPTVEQVEAIIAAAHRLEVPSIGLAIALQFETTIRQWDIIGQWVPLSSPGASPVSYGSKRKWFGLTWDHIDADMVLRVTPSKTNHTTMAKSAADLQQCPLALREIALVPAERRVGPVIVSERTGHPWTAQQFNRAWRKVARAAGVPDEVWSRDMRAGGVTEGREAGAALEDTAKLASHVGTKTTARVYDRDVLEASRRVSKARVARRKAAAPEQA